MFDVDPLESKVTVIKENKQFDFDLVEISCVFFSALCCRRVGLMHLKWEEEPLLQSSRELKPSARLSFDSKVFHRSSERIQFLKSCYPSV